MNVHACAALRCERRIPINLLMCKKHWDMVPEFVQKKVYAGRRQGLQSRVYISARQEAIDIVERSEAQRTPPIIDREIP